MTPLERRLGKTTSIPRTACLLAVAIIMNVTVYPMTLLWTIIGIIAFPLAFPIWKAATGWESGRIMRAFIWIYGRVWMGIVSPFVRFRREGLENIHGKHPLIIVLNHLSFFDTYCMALFPFSDIVFAVRSWPFKMFWYSPFMRLASYLDIEGSAWEETKTKCKEILKKGSAILFFPEGHRSKDGHLKRFHSGAFKLSVDTGIHILPVCITGTDVLLPPDRWWLFPTKVCFRVLPPIDPKAFVGSDAHMTIRNLVRNTMARHVAEMRGKQ